MVYNYDMLNKLKHEDMSYIIGLFQGDAHLSETTRNRGRLSYEVSKGDSDIVYKIRDLLVPYVRVSVYKRKRTTNFKADYESIILNIFNIEFRKSISVFIPVGKKSSKVCPSSDLSIRDYVRGLIDADGSLGLTNNERCFISLCTSSDSIKDYFLKSVLDVTGRRKIVSRNKRDNVYNIVLNDEDAQVYADYLYKDSKLYIDRKYRKYEQLMGWVRKPGSVRIFSKTWIDSEDEIVLSKTLSLEEKMKKLDRTKMSVNMRIWRLNNKNK